LLTYGSYSPRQCLDRAKPAEARSVMDGRAALAILLVVEPERDGIGKE
jgi:hypothetical protein